MNPQEELNQLLERQEALHQELKERKKELLEAQRVRKDPLKRQIRRAQSRISAAERKRRTRRLILIGSYMEHVTRSSPELCVKVRGSSSMLRLGCFGDLLGLEE